MGQKVTKFGIFQTPPANFLLSRGVTPERNVAEYCNAEKNLLSTDGCSTRVPGLVNFGLQTRAPGVILLFLKTNDMGE